MLYFSNAFAIICESKQCTVNYNKLSWGTRQQKCTYTDVFYSVLLFY